jgi:hypothetical protein
LGVAESIAHRKGAEEFMKGKRQTSKGKNEREIRRLSSSFLPFAFIIVLCAFAFDFHSHRFRL